jgi:hypothetical protein
MRDVDLDVDRYLLFRFETQEDAQRWGADSDLDYWPDEIEDASGTDKCDPVSHPAGNPPQLAAIVNKSDMSSLRTLANGMKQRFYVDSAPQPNNHVFWYRMIAVDQFDNQSPLSPPVRGVLWDRTQPDPEAGIKVERCRYTIEMKPCQVPGDIRFVFLEDTRTRKAASICFFEACPLRETPGGIPGYKYILLFEKLMREGRAEVSYKDLQRFCQSLCEERGNQNRFFVVKYYDENGRVIATTEVFTTIICGTEGGLCFYLKVDCHDSQSNPGEALDPNSPINICVKLNPGERARVFHELNGKMSPFGTIHAPTDAIAADIYCITEDLTAIVPAGACLGVRVFSKNNVGSFIKYLNCVTVPSGKPDAPLLHSADPTGTQAIPKFTVRWAAQGEGLSAFVLSQQKNGKIEYETYWINDSNLTYNNGLYEVVLDLNPATDLNQECCFKVKAIDKALVSSDWSESLCSTWEKEPGEHLTWPPVPKTTEGSGILAYFLNAANYPIPMLVLSENLEGILDLTQRCKVTMSDCRETVQGKGCLTAIPFNCTGICDQLKAANRFGKFIVFRQEEGRDFVQVSPLIDTFWCYREEKKVIGGAQVSMETLDDPFIYLVHPNDALILAPAIRPEVNGLRLLFADNFPFRRGSKIRYQVMVVDPNSGEGTAMHYSNWLTIP